MTNHGTVKKSFRPARARNALRHVSIIKVQSDKLTTAIIVNGSILGTPTKIAAIVDAAPSHKIDEKNEKI